MPICKIVLDWLDSSTYFQNTMIKYIVIETYEVKDINPFWYAGCCERIESKYLHTTRSNVMKFNSQEDLAEYLSVSYSASKNIQVFEVAKELIPMLETKTTVTFK